MQQIVKTRKTVKRLREEAKKRVNVFGDLHTHTAFSREADNFLEIRLKDYAEAKRKMPELGIVGVVDHDTLNYLEPMYRAKRLFDSGELPLLLPGIEITSAFELPGAKGELVRTHLLGYFPQLIEEDSTVIRQINEALEPTMQKVLDDRRKKIFETGLSYFFDNRIIPSNWDFNELKAEVLKRYEQDKDYVASMEPKEGDIINWPINTSDKLILDVLIEKGAIGTYEEGKLYVDRINEDRIRRLGMILAKKESLSETEALKEAKRLQGSCHVDGNAAHYELTTQKAIALIRSVGGIPILAHPMVILKKFKDGVNDFFSYCKKELLPAGLQGIEAFYPKQDFFTPLIIQFCKNNGIHITGGSDDHQDGRNHIGEKGARCPIEYITDMLDPNVNK